VQTTPSRIASDSSVSTVAVAQLPGFKQEAKAMREQLDMAASVALADAQ
jgi:hypothetical protein